MHLPGMLHAAFGRNPHAHATFESIDVTAARALPGVVAVLTAVDLADRVGVMQPIGPQGSPHAALRPLASDRVRSRRPIAIVVASSRAIAEDACELIEATYSPIEAIVSIAAALDADKPAVFDSAGTNKLYNETWNYGDVDEAFAAATHVVAHTFPLSRMTNAPMETDVWPLWTIDWWRLAKSSPFTLPIISSRLPVTSCQLLSNPSPPGAGDRPWTLAVFVRAGIRQPGRRSVAAALHDGAAGELGSRTASRRMMAVMLQTNSSMPRSRAMSKPHHPRRPAAHVHRSRLEPVDDIAVDHVQLARAHRVPQRVPHPQFPFPVHGRRDEQGHRGRLPWSLGRGNVVASACCNSWPARWALNLT